MNATSFFMSVSVVLIFARISWDNAVFTAEQENKYWIGKAGFVWMSPKQIIFRSEHVRGAEGGEFPLPAHVGVRSPCSTAQSRSRPLRPIPLPAHLTISSHSGEIAPRSL